MRWHAVVALVLASSGSSSGCGQKSCGYSYEIRLAPSQSMSGPCGVALDAGHDVARYEVRQPCTSAAVVWIVDGPAPDGVDSSGGCGLTMYFSDSAPALADFLGGHTFTATLTCNGYVVDHYTVGERPTPCAM